MTKGGLLLFSLLSPIMLSGAGSIIAPAASVENPASAVMIERARTANNSGEYERAAEILREALGKSKQEGRPDNEAKCLLNLGVTLWDLGQMQEAADKFAEAGLLFEKIGDIKNRDVCAKGREIARNYGLGKDSRSANRPKESLEYFDKAIALGRFIGIVDFELKCLRQKSLTYWQLGDFENFHYCNERGLEIAKKIHHRKEVARCLNNIGVYYDRLSDYATALRHYGLALNEAEDGSDTETQAEALSNIGGIYLELEISSQAELFYRRALSLDKAIGRNEDIAKDLNNLGIVLLKRGQLAHNNKLINDSLQCFDECRRHLDKKSGDEQLIRVINNIGYARYALGEFSAAKSEFNKSLAEASKSDYSTDVGTILNNLGYIEYQSKCYQNAILFFNNALEISLKQASYAAQVDAYYGLGCCHEDQGELIRALAFYKKSIEALERIRKRISFDIFKISFARNKTNVYERALDILCALSDSDPSDKRIEEISEMMDRAKAQAFVESLSGIGLQDGNITGADATALEKRISGDIAVLNIRLASAKTSEVERKVLLNELEDKEQEYMRVISDIKAGTHSVEGVHLIKLPNIPEVQGLLLNEKSAILEYFVGEKKSYLILLTFHRCELYSLPGRAELEASLRGYLKCLSSPSRGQFEGILAAERIAGELLAPLLHEKNSKINTLIVIPDGILHYLPFETLRVSEGGGHRYLLEKYRVSYAPSISALLLLKGRSRAAQASKDFLALGAPGRPDFRTSREFGNGNGMNFWRDYYIDRSATLSPLPFSKAEITEAAEVFPTQKRDMYLGDQASETVLKKLPLGEYRILHFACHAVLDDRFPFRSALVLSPDESKDEDGFLQVREIYNLKMDADMVVLSACQSGSGTLEQGEGLVGLTRGFFQAGAHSIISSLWSINDRSTAEFMKDFYAELARGEDKSSALRVAKLKALKSSHGHPFYWAAFILSGDPSPIWPVGQKNRMPN